MRHVTVSALVFAVVVTASASNAQEAPAPTSKTFGLAAELLSGYQMVQRNLTEAAEKMPEEHYAFKPSPEIKPFGQLVAHVSLAQFRTCAMLKGEPSPKKDEKEETTRTKADQIALLKASTAYCDPLVTPLTDATMTELAKAGNNQIAKGLVPISLVAHGYEMYGTMAVYMRLKGLVPPTTERSNQMKTESKKSSQ